MWSDPPSSVSWTWAGARLGNTTRVSVREWAVGGAVTSVLDIRDLGPGQAGVYTCAAKNRGGRVVDTRRVVIRDSDILEQLVRLKLYVMAGVGGCVVLLSSFIAAACIFTARRKQSDLRAFKYSRHERGSWCDTDSLETVTDVKPFFKFGRDKFASEAGYSETEHDSSYQLLPTQPPPHEASDQQQRPQPGATPDILMEHTCGGGTRHARLAVIQEGEVTSPGSSEGSSGDSGVCVGRVVR